MKAHQRLPASILSRALLLLHRCSLTQRIFIPFSCKAF